MPARIYCFFSIDRLNDVPGHHFTRQTIDSPGCYAVIASVTQNIYETPIDSDEENFRAHPSQSLLYKLKLVMRRDNGGNITSPHFYIVKVTSSIFESPVIAVPYDIEDTVVEEEWIIIEPRHKWCDIFQECIDDLCEMVKDTLR